MVCGLGLGFRVKGLGFRAQGLRFMVYGLNPGFQTRTPYKGILLGLSP
jgi:hypothetical protein